MLTFYRDDIYYLPNRGRGDMKTVAKLDLEDVNNTDVKLLRTVMDKLYSEWTFDERREMSLFKITGLSIIKNLSGGHPSITNIQGLNFLDERRDAIQRYFGKTVIPVPNADGTIVYKYIQSYEDLMIFFANEYLNILRGKLTGDSELPNNIVLNGNSSESII